MHNRATLPWRGGGGEGTYPCERIHSLHLGLVQEFSDLEAQSASSEESEPNDDDMYLEELRNESATKIQKVLIHASTALLTRRAWG